MFSFKKNQLSKEQKRESKRRWAIVKEQLYPILLEDCKSVNEMKHRLESTLQAIKNELMIKVETFKHELQAEQLKMWKVKPLEGKGVATEQKILDILGTEPVEVADQILTHFPRIIDSFITEEMANREPESLKIKFPE